MTSPLDKLPPDVRQALIEGRALDAIKLLRQSSGVSLKSAAQRIEGLKAHVPPRPVATAANAPIAHPQHVPSNPEPLYQEGLAPGEVPRARESIWTWVALLVALGAFARWRGWF